MRVKIDDCVKIFYKRRNWVLCDFNKIWISLVIDLLKYMYILDLIMGNKNYIIKFIFISIEKVIYLIIDLV